MYCMLATFPFSCQKKFPANFISPSKSKLFHEKNFLASHNNLNNLEREKERERKREKERK